MGDENVMSQIDKLAQEEHELFERESRGAATDADRERLHRIQVMLDQCWDLLRQRRARDASSDSTPIKRALVTRKLWKVTPADAIRSDSATPLDR